MHEFLKEGGKGGGGGGHGCSQTLETLNPTKNLNPKP